MVNEKELLSKLLVELRNPSLKWAIYDGRQTSYKTKLKDGFEAYLSDANTLTVYRNADLVMVSDKNKDITPLYDFVRDEVTGERKRRDNLATLAGLVEQHKLI